MQERFFSPGMDVGVGVNLLTGEALVKGVTGSITPPDATGQRVESRIIRIEDISSLYKSLSVGVSASGSYLGFSASAKVDYADSCGLNEHSIYLLVAVVVTNTLTRMDSPALIPEAAQLLQNNKPDRFRERFGDVYVAGIHTGGEYFAIFQITGTDETEKESLSTLINASFSTIGASANLSAKIANAKQQSHSHLDVRVFTFQNGGSDTSQDQDPGQIMAKAHNFAPSLHGDNARFAVAYSILPESYRTLDLPGDAANLIDIENQKEMLAKNFAVRNQLMLLINNIDYILLSQAQNHNEFEDFDVAALTQDRNRLAAEFDQITKEASNCMRDATSCHLASFQPNTTPLPKKRAGQQIVDAKLDRDWRGGNASPEVFVDSGANNFIARGRMKLDLPHLSRIDKFRAIVKINTKSPNSFSELHIDLQRESRDSPPQVPDQGEPVIKDISVPYEVGMAEISGFPVSGTELIDNQHFQYFVNATYIVHNFNPSGIVVPADSVVWQSFEFDLKPG
jgi:hypothetical protein